MTRKTVHDTSAAVTAAASTPAFASARCSLSKASDAMSSETVKPTPADAPAPVTEPQPTGGRNRPRDTAVTSIEGAGMPIGLPATEPTRVPRGPGDVDASARKNALRAG